MLINGSVLKVAVIGLGYVGLPLALEFSKKYSVVGFDISAEKIGELKSGLDVTREIERKQLLESQIVFTNDIQELKSCNFYIVCVPTPVDVNNKPDLTFLESASQLVGTVIESGDTVVFESTVYPGATEEVCIPKIEYESGLRCIFDRDFYDEDECESDIIKGFHCGYSPERINPGDKTRTLSKIIKVTSGSSKKSALFIDSVYKTTIEAGTFMASSIKVAEAAKVIENTQRDLNIALINELTMIFDRLGIDTEQVLLAAETKWNFLSFRPGLVGGHCIGIDPYYLTHKAELVGYKPKVILAGRNLNDSMHKFVVDKALLTLRAAELNYERPKVLICGFSFKENCPDIRNSKIVNLYHEFIQNGCDVDVTDPHVDPKDGLRHYNIALTASPKFSGYHLVLLAVAHDEYRTAGAGYFKEFCCEGGLFFDMKYVFPSDKSDLRL